MLLATCGYGVVLFHASASGQQPLPANPAAYKNLPEGPGKTALVRMCSICHELERVLAVRQTPQGWATILENMSQRGASGTDEEWDALFEYLSQHFTPRQATPPRSEDGKVRAAFTTAAGGGSIQVVAVDAADAATVLQIRTQLHDAVKRFRSGDYGSPKFIDAQRKPGTESLKAFAAQIKYDVEELPGGGRILIGATDPEAMAAVQIFIRAQQRPDR
jgi:competence protein ComEA